MTADVRTGTRERPAVERSLTTLVSAFRALWTDTFTTVARRSSSAQAALTGCSAVDTVTGTFSVSPPAEHVCFERSCAEYRP